MKKEALRVSTTIPAAPTTLYLAWLNAEQHSAMTGGVAKIDSQVGGKFTAWNGYITGKLVILDLGRRIVMSWRTTDFPRDDPDSRVELHLEALGGSTRLTVLHTDIPEGQSEKYRETWNEKYFTPMRTFFSKYLPDPRQPPPPRRPIPPEDEEEEEEEQEEAPKKKGKLAAKAAPPAKAVAKPAAKPAPAPAKPKSAPPPPKSAKAPPPKAKPASKPAPKKAAAKPAAKKPAAKKPAAKGKKK
ncbi:MAG TPA: SRPBCC domain-containing protein [Labilithrix sp.]|nr:SRPBCC domain-containing protein [Labilithrix sp.]